ELIGEPSEDDDIPADEIFNDLAVRYSYQADTVEQVLVTPDETITFDEIISAFGEPTQDLSPEDIGSTVRILTYQPADDANFYIAVEGDGDDNVSLIYPSQLTNAEVVNEDNVMDFISAYYDKNVLDMSLINFEDPVFSEADGYFEIPFVNVHHGLTGLFRVWPYGQIDYINENGEYAYGEFIPYADGEIKSVLYEGGIFMWFIVIIAVAGIIAGIISNYLNHRKEMETIKIEQIDKEVELQRLKQENYLLENEEMKVVLDRIKEDNERHAAEKNSPWLIQETRDRQLEEKKES